MRVLFLDFDGVVITRHKDRVRLDSGRWVRAATPENVEHLNTIVLATNALVVVSSSWRKHHQLTFLEGTLRRAGFVGRLHGVTPAHQSAPDVIIERGDEIAEWLLAHKVESYCVLDDDSDRGSIPAERWILTDTFVGLTAEIAQRAIAVLRAEAKAA